MWENTSQRARSKLLTSSRGSPCQPREIPQELDAKISTLYLLELSCVCHLENMGQSVGVRGTEEGTFHCFSPNFSSLHVHSLHLTPFLWSLTWTRPEGQTLRWSETWFWFSKCHLAPATHSIRGWATSVGWGNHSAADEIWIYLRHNRNEGHAANRLESIWSWEVK